MQNITLIGTNHISKESVDLIKQQFADIKPDIIAVELDSGRLEGLESGQPSKLSISLISRVGVVGYIFLIIGRYVQKKFGKIMRIQPGLDMLTAVRLARNSSVQLALIDRPMDKTLKLLSKKFTFREKLRVCFDVTLGLLFGPKQKIQLNKIPNNDLLADLLILMKRRYPTLYTVLLDQRNQYMARKLLKLSWSHPDAKILAVVGAGHVSGMNFYLDLFYKEYFPKAK